MKLTHASLFSGFGGPDLAARWMGWDNAFHCEINPFCNTILNYHFPKSKSYKDVTTTDFTPWLGKIDVLTGGFPCQPFSVAGQRKGADDNRYLWPHFLRAIREIQPPWVIGENVAGILTMVQPGEEIKVGCQASLFDEDNTETVLEQEFVVETICQDLEREGYSVQPIVIPACAVGAPHRRDRVWFVASRNTPSDSHCRTNTGKPRKYEEASRKERVQEWNEIRKSVEPGCVRRIASDRADSGTKDVWSRREDEILSGRAAADSDLNRLGDGQDEQEQFSECKGTPNDCTCCEDGAATHPNGKRCDNRSDNRKERYLRYDWQRYSQEDKPEQYEWKRGTCENGSVTSYAQRKGGGQVYKEVQSEQSDGNGINGISHERNASYTESKQLENPLRAWEWVTRFANTHSERGWQDFPTQPPVCRGNDGLPFDVVRLTIPYPRWRAESIKGYGNAIVPEVVFEIFKAIQETYN